MTCIIVGGGIAGFQAAMTCRSVRPDRAVTLIDAEEETGYHRTLLPQFMVGALRRRSSSSGRLKMIRSWRFGPASA